MKRLAVVVMVLLVGVATPASAQIVIPPPPVIGPISPPVIGVPVVPDLPPSWGDSPSIGDSLCAGGLGWLGSAFGWCSKNENNEYQVDPPYVDAEPFEPYGERHEGVVGIIDALVAMPDAVVLKQGVDPLANLQLPAGFGSIAFAFRIPEAASSGDAYVLAEYMNGRNGTTGGTFIIYNNGRLWRVAYTDLNDGYWPIENWVSVPGGHVPGAWVVVYAAAARGAVGTSVGYLEHANAGDFWGRPFCLGSCGHWQRIETATFVQNKGWSLGPPSDVLLGPVVGSSTRLEEYTRVGAGKDVFEAAQTAADDVSVEVSGRFEYDPAEDKKRLKEAWAEWLDSLPPREPEVELEPEPEYVQEDEFPSVDPQGQTDSDWILGNRLAGFFGSLLGGIWDAITWLGSLLRSLFQWLIDELWAIARWFYEALSSLIDLVITAVGAVVAAIVALGNMLHGLISIVIQLLGQILTYLVGIAGAVITAIPAILLQLLAVLEAIATWLFALPELIFGLFWEVMIWLFVPQNPTVGSIDWPPVITGWPGVFDGVPDVIGTAINSSCGPSLDLQVGDFDQHLTFNTPTPGAVCGGNGPGGLVTAMDLQAGDLYGYRSALRALISFGLVVAFVRVNLRALGIGNEAVEAIPVGPV